MSGPARVVVVGADAAGMSAAHQALRTAKRTGRELAVTVLDRGTHTSYSACGIPYWMAGDVDSGDDLVARTAEAHRESRIDLRMGIEVVAADLSSRTVTTDAGEVVAYDELVVATGSPAVVPDWALRPDGTTYDGVGAVKTLDDGAAWIDRFALADAGTRVVVVGAGYVGVEVAEAALRRGFAVTVLTRGRGMSMLEDEMSERVNAALEQAGVDLVLGAEVTGLETDGDRVTGVRWDGGSREAALVVVAIGVRPATGFLRGTGIEMTEAGALRPDPHGRVAEHVWAAGDCCEVRRRIDDEWVFRPLGTYATKHGRALGDSLAGGSLAFDGMVDTSITRFSLGEVNVEIARTGLSRKDAVAAGLDPVALLTEGTTASGYMPEAEPIALWVMADRATRRLLGVQVVGGQGAGKRIDAAAAVLWAGGTVDDLAWMDLAYAPPFATAWEILQVAARRVAERL
ncbi:NADPH-dependent 2,4-dienoyl-CoA reductase, sulfur reductase [Nocardioides alpinus]|uniref:CoA-disulfide reductase n=1 Tax=Nocardioides alpinus TaxID=748909 RepID=A0A1I0YMJ3_9ACTN|nr:FAD-dependent oxidoreductase [Nocardioides alpinus]PKH43595.1 CoA-disulfide reductase [Nocardioides alpinus]SFB14016.1 NADPH-dependent 2,4-dienoyl-CoA reductase, sulfur reductase [Nocardioides alpinus]